MQSRRVSCAVTQTAFTLEHERLCTRLSLNAPRHRILRLRAADGSIGGCLAGRLEEEGGGRLAVHCGFVRCGEIFAVGSFGWSGVSSGRCGRGGPGGAVVSGTQDTGHRTRDTGEGTQGEA